ncbi:MAG TPA: hypothetical protein VMD91_09115 [Candidatus Sulfotelmatobacter sp.]|nr:hypothetical protein [Candidatus Sulfotelmatobacter sp.]
MRSSLLAASVAVALALCGCSAASGPGTNVCSTPPIPIVQLASPPGGSTGVSPSIGELVLAESSPTVGNVTVTVSSPAGTIVSGATPTSAPSPLPSPLASPLPGTIVYFSIGVPVLSANTSYTVRATYSVGGSGACPTSFPMTAGSFTTG